MTQAKKRAQFSELTTEKKRIVSKKCFDVVLVCNFRGSLIREKYNFASSQFILDKAEYYANNFASSSEKVEYIKQKKEYESLAKSNGIYFRDDTKYQGYIKDISTIESMEELHEYIKGKNPSGKEIPIHSLNLAIADRTRALGDPDGLFATVKKKLLDYSNYKADKRAKENLNKSILTQEENRVLAKVTLEDFLNSEFIYKQDYCKDKKLSVNTFDKRVAIIRDFDSEFYSRYIQEMENKKQRYYDTLKPIVEEILDNISNSKEYNIIDYYLAYRDLYTFEDLCHACNKYKMDIRSLKTFFSKADVRSSLTHDAFLSEKYIAFSHEFSVDEKEKIYQYSKENRIPFNWHNVSLLVSKYYKNNKTNKSNKLQA